MDNLGNSESVDIKPKKTFNKKKWREHKYSKHKKIEEWQEKRKKAAFQRYRKVLKKELPPGKSIPSFQNFQDVRSKKTSRYQEAVLEYERIQQEKLKQKEEARQAAEERKAAFKMKRKIRADRNRKLSQRTPKGQPIMENQINVLLEKIESMQ